MGLRILNTFGKEYAPEARKILEKLGKVDYLSLAQDKLPKLIGDYDIAVVGLDVRYDKDVLLHAKKLKMIATATTGTDHIDLEFAKENGIEILSLKDETSFLENITGTSELAFGLLIDLFRNITNSYIDVLSGNWNRHKHQGNNLPTKTLGIVGLGRLGKMMARYGKAFGMHVIAVDPFVQDTIFELEGVEKCTFEDLLKESDVISIHIHLTPETKDMFNAKAFASMKNTAYIVNTSRGQIVKEDDIIKALDSNKIAGYATDVLDGELYFEDKGTLGHPLVQYAKKHNTVIITPHIGGMTNESRPDTDVFIAKKLEKFLS